MTWALDPSPVPTRVTVTATQVPDGTDPDVHVAAIAGRLSQLAAHLAR